jgi:hypothetical protein
VLAEFRQGNVTAVVFPEFVAKGFRRNGKGGKQQPHNKSSHFNFKNHRQYGCNGLVARAGATSMAFPTRLKVSTNICLSTADHAGLMHF